jgi:uncharacterized protein YerC
MVHISKDKLDDVLRNKLFNELVHFIAPKSKASAENILGDLLTKTEKVMLAKRLAAIFMISEKVSLYKTATRLKLSTSTVKRMYTSYSFGEYDRLLGELNRRKVEKEKFWELIELISRAGMPSMGKRRWQSLR